MSPLTLFTAFILVLFLFGVYVTRQKAGKILCFYDGVDKSVEKKWVKVQDKKVTFSRMKFDIIPDCIQSYIDRSGIHYLFPTKVNVLRFVWYSRYPVNPNDYKRTWDTPELRNMLNLEEQLKSFFKNFVPPNTKKVSGLTQYLPIIAIFLVIAVGLIMFSQLEGMKQVINMMQNQINTITPR